MTANIDDNLKQNFDHASGLFVLTDKDGKVVYTNEAVKSKTGFSVGEAVGKKPGELWGGVMPVDYYERLWHTIGADGLPFAGAVNNRKKSGENYSDQLLAAPILDSAGATRYYFQFSPDSSQISSAEQLTAEFSAVFTQQKIDSGLVLDFINKWLALKENELKNYYAAQAEAREDKIVEFFRHVLVAPTAVSLLNRSDDRLLIIAAQQNKDHFAKLYIKYHDQIYDYFYHRVGFDGTLADDLTQETFVSAFKRLPDFKVSNSSYLTYLLRVAHNNLVNYYRKIRVISLEANPEIPPPQEAPHAWHHAVVA